MPEATMSGGETLKGWREKHEKSQTKFAEEVGVRQATLSEWEKGVKNPQIKHAIRIQRLTEGAVPVTCWAPDEDDGAEPRPVGGDA